MARQTDAQGEVGTSLRAAQTARATAGARGPVLPGRAAGAHLLPRWPPREDPARQTTTSGPDRVTHKAIACVGQQPREAVGPATRARTQGRGTQEAACAPPPVAARGVPPRDARAALLAGAATLLQLQGAVGAQT